MWNRGQLNDWKYAAANRALELFNEAGLHHCAVAGTGHGGSGVAEMSDTMVGRAGCGTACCSKWAIWLTSC